MSRKTAEVYRAKRWFAACCVAVDWVVRGGKAQCRLAERVVNITLQRIIPLGVILILNGFVFKKHKNEVENRRAREQKDDQKWL